MKFEIELWKGGREGWAGRSYAPLRFAFHSLVIDFALGRLLCCSCLGRAGCWLIAGLVVSSIGGWNLPFRLLARAALTVFDHLA